MYCLNMSRKHILKNFHSNSEVITSKLLGNNEKLKSDSQLVDYVQMLVWISVAQAGGMDPPPVFRGGVPLWY